MIVSFMLAVVASGSTFTCTPTRVWDGDGPIWCSEGPKIRLAGIAAREIDGVCKPHHPCPPASGPAARDALVSLLGRRTGVAPTGHVLLRAQPLRCLSDGSGNGDRTAAWCRTSGGLDLSCAMVRNGYALRWPRYWRNHRCS